MCGYSPQESLHMLHDSEYDDGDEYDQEYDDGDDDLMIISRMTCGYSPQES